MPPYKTSMLLDYEQGRPLETEAILGNALRAGQRAGVDTPYLESVYALMKLKMLDYERRHIELLQDVGIHCESPS